jgi:hypothetical protein
VDRFYREDRKKTMPTMEIIPDAYPEQLMAAMRDEISRIEREQAARDAAARRRQERRAALRARLAGWFTR